jgi:Transposase
MYTSILHIPRIPTVYKPCVKSLPILIGCSPDRPAKDVQKMLSNNLGVDVHLNTVRNTFKKVGLRTIKRPSKPKLSVKNIKARLEFANQHKYWTAKDWKNVIWSEASTSSC